jgi:RNA polymerase sigma-70 factor, ECF subfamily
MNVEIEELRNQMVTDLGDEQLLEVYKSNGDRNVFEVLVQRYQREIYSYLRRYLADAELADDAFQGTFLQVHLKCQQFDDSRRFRPWLYAIATNQAIDVQRRVKRHRMASLDRAGISDDSDGNWSEKLVGGDPDPLMEAALRENGEWVRTAIDSLSESMKQAVHLVYYQGLKYREAADVLGIPVGTVKSRLHAAVQRLSLLWDETHDSPFSAD